MLEKVLLVLAIMVGAVLGTAMSWNFHEIVEGNFAFLGRHFWLCMVLAAIFFFWLAKAIYDTRKHSPRPFGLLMLLTASGSLSNPSATCRIPRRIPITPHSFLSSLLPSYSW